MDLYLVDAKREKKKKKFILAFSQYLSLLLFVS